MNPTTIHLKCSTLFTVTVSPCLLPAVPYYDHTLNLQSIAMPMEMHFLKRHSWHWLRVILSMMQQPSYLHE